MKKFKLFLLLISLIPFQTYCAQPKSVVSTLSSAATGLVNKFLPSSATTAATSSNDDKVSKENAEQSASTPAQTTSIFKHKATFNYQNEVGEDIIFGTDVGLVALAHGRVIESWDLNGKHKVQIAPKDTFPNTSNVDEFACETVAYIPASKKAQRSSSVVYARRDGTIYLWNPQTKVSTPLAEKHVGVRALKYLASSGTFASLSAHVQGPKTVVNLWDAKKGIKTGTLEYGYSRPDASCVASIPSKGNSPQLLAIANAGNKGVNIKLWDLKTQKEYGELDTNQEDCGTLQYIKESNLLAASTRTRLVIFDIDKKQQVFAIDKPFFHRIAYIPKLELIAIEVDRNKIELLDLLNKTVTGPHALPGQEDAMGIKYFQKCKSLIAFNYLAAYRYELDPEFVKKREEEVAAWHKKQEKIRKKKTAQKNTANTAADSKKDAEKANDTNKKENEEQSAIVAK